MIEETQANHHFGDSDFHEVAPAITPDTAQQHQHTEGLVDPPKVEFIAAPIQSPEFDLDHIFTYHPATDEQIVKYQAIREAAKHFAQTVLDNSPPSCDQSTAIQKIREAVMTANAAVALDGRLFNI